MDKYNLFVDQITHFIDWVENFNVINFVCTHKNASITSKTRPTICIPSTTKYIYIYK